MPAKSAHSNKNQYVISLRRALIAAGLLLILPASALAQSPAAPVPVVASFSILGDLVKQVGKDRVAVATLVGPNADAHVYRAKPSDAKALKDARLVVVNGLGFEGFMPRLIKSSGTKAEIVTASAGIRTLERAAKGGHDHGHGHDHGKLDPHAWQSIEAAKVYVGNIRDGLATVDPAGAAAYRANADAYLGELAKLGDDLKAQFDAIPREKRIVLTNHDAFQYFAREFDLAFVSVQGLSTEGDPSAKDVARVIRLAKERKAGAVFVENMASPRIAEQLARESGAKLGGTLFSDALSDENGKAPTYIAMMRHNAAMLVEALR
jgi:zinc/manganese transport system substrate-binding protein